MGVLHSHPLPNVFGSLLGEPLLFYDLLPFSTPIRFTPERFTGDLPLEPLNRTFSSNTYFLFPQVPGLMPFLSEVAFFFSLTRLCAKKSFFLFHLENRSCDTRALLFRALDPLKRGSRPSQAPYNLSKESWSSPTPSMTPWRPPA